MNSHEKALLQILSRQYPNIAAASTEIINMKSILNLPKGTEHFITDLHGEYEQFNHVLKNGSGSVRKKIDDEFGNTLSIRDKRSLATLIYYPAEKLDIVRREEENLEDWYRITLNRLVHITNRVSSKYTRSKVRKALPVDFAYIIEELITEKEEILDKEAYYNEIINTIISIGCADRFVIAMAELIQRLVIDHLHIVGDIFDRGPGPHIIMDTLCDYHSVDVQWGNHDVLWMGAAAGNLACIATAIRIAARYDNLDCLEEGYGINLMPLATFAMKVYGGSDCERFAIHRSKFSEGERGTDSMSDKLNMRMHKAISIIQFKLEGQIIAHNPDYKMSHRYFLDKIDLKKGTVVIDDKEYKLLDTDFPTIDPNNPYYLTPEEEDVMHRLRKAFLFSEKLQRHVSFLYSNGGMYKVYNSNLLFHGCVPLDENGEFISMEFKGKQYSGKKLFDLLESLARKGQYVSRSIQGVTPRDYRDTDIFWYMWAGPLSPLFGKDRMTTFERYFIADKNTHTEKKNHYYKLYDNPDIVRKILEEFGLDYDKSHIINGHMPVEMKKGETPIKCGGKVLVIDGGFSRAYHEKTGIAGYTLISNSYGMKLVAHEKFTSAEDCISCETDIISDNIMVESRQNRMLVADTDAGHDMINQISQLEVLLKAYRDGTLTEKVK